MIQGLFSNNALQGPQSLGIRDYLDKTETKKKDKDIKRLQEKVK